MTEAPTGLARVIAITNQKGGVGKTTTAINLGAGLAERGARVLIVDLDPQGNASTGLGFYEGSRGGTAYDVIAQGAPIMGAVVESSYPRLSILAASGDLSGVDTELMDDPDRAGRLRRALGVDTGDGAASAFDVILLDCPPSLNILTVNALTAAASVMVPLQCEFFALEGLSQLLGTIRRVQQRLNPALVVEGIVLTMYDRRNNLSAEVALDVRENLGDRVYDTIIPRNVRLSEAPSHGTPILAYDPESMGAKAYRRLAAEVARRTGVEPLQEA
ncbi:MAG: ParA family protein [Pseudomonadota bacterium]